MGKKELPSKELSSIIAFIFGGAVVGETLALSMIVSVIGTEIIGKFYLVNGVLLFFLPVLFFRSIDRFNRGRILSNLIVITVLFILTYLIIFLLNQRNGLFNNKILLYTLYPISYLSKTILFLTFWTLANDICHTRETKKQFPIISAWGFVGGFSGAIIARFLLEIASPAMTLGLWVFAYINAYFLLKRLIGKYSFLILKKENVRVHNNKTSLLAGVKEIWDEKLIRNISILYLFVFMGIFSIDYLFWSRCHVMFPGEKSLASFQFNFYILHSLVTIYGLFVIMPKLITKIGFANIFFFLPVALFSGALSILFAGVSGVSVNIVFAVIIVVQFLRYITFENAFSPVYQMFFAFVERDKRGRAKTLMDGIIKPSAIISSGIILIALDSVPYGILLSIIFVSGGMLIMAGRVKKAYQEKLFPSGIKRNMDLKNIILEFGSYYDKKILSLLKEYSDFKSADLRALAVDLLKEIGTRESFATLKELYDKEECRDVREKVARSLKGYYWYEAKEFIQKLLKDPNPRIRSNAIYSLNGMKCFWKEQLYSEVKKLLFDKNVRVQLEVAEYLWECGREKDTVNAFLGSLLESENSRKRSAGVYLAGRLKPSGWEDILLDNMSFSSRKVYLRSIEIIFSSCTEERMTQALHKIEEMSRYHIASAGKVISRSGRRCAETAGKYLAECNSRRMIYEIVHALRIYAENRNVREKSKIVDQKTEEIIFSWILGELENVYRDGCIWNVLLKKGNISYDRSYIKLLDSALNERLFRVCEWALDTLVLVESRGAIALGLNELDLNDPSQRFDMIEIVECFGSSRLVSLIIPILEYSSWDVIEKRGREYFNFKESVASEGIIHFLRSDNKWVALCSLYCYIRICDSNPADNKHTELIEKLEGDRNRYLSNAAKCYSYRNCKRVDDKMPDTFKLLEIVLFFKKTILFRNVQAEKLMPLAEISSIVDYEKGRTISREGDISNHLFIVKKGSVRIVKIKRGVTTILSIIRKGEAYGEIRLFNQVTRTASAVANEKCELIVVDRKAFRKLLMEIPEIAYNFLEIFSEKLRRGSEELALLNSTYKSTLSK